MASAPWSRRSPLRHVGGDVVERAADLVTQRVHDGDDDAGDGGDDQTVLDRGGAVLVIEKLLQVAEHRVLSFVFRASGALAFPELPSNVVCVRGGTSTDPLSSLRVGTRNAGLPPDRKSVV